MNAIAFHEAEKRERAETNGKILKFKW